MQQKSLNSFKLYGFGILKNGVKFDFPFRESLLSFKSLVDKAYYVLGDSVDNTNEEFKKFEFCLTEYSTWDASLKDGLVISVETNKAIDFLKRSIELENSWGIYLQADEVLHQDDYDLIKSDIIKADALGCDAITFRYLHFWKTHHHIAISKNWYPKEIRIIKLDSDIVSCGDGQSFTNYKKVFNSESRIFHYGHVRVAEAYEQKMQFQASFHFKGLRYYRKRLKNRLDRMKQKAIEYYGTHPLVMKDRILRMHDVWELPAQKIIYILGSKKDYSELMINSINVNEIFWVDSEKEIPRNYRSQAVITNSFLEEKWSNDCRLTLQLSEKKIGLKYNK